MPNYYGTLGAEAFSNETCEDSWGGGLNQEVQETGGRFPATLPRHCAATCCWSGSLHWVTRDPLSRQVRFKEDMSGKNGEREKYIYLNKPSS